MGYTDPDRCVRYMNRPILHPDQRDSIGQRDANGKIKPEPSDHRPPSPTIAVCPSDTSCAYRLNEHRRRYYWYCASPEGSAANNQRYRYGARIRTTDGISKAQEGTRHSTREHTMAAYGQVGRRTVHIGRPKRLPCEVSEFGLRLVSSPNQLADEVAAKFTAALHENTRPTCAVKTCKVSGGMIRVTSRR